MASIEYDADALHHAMKGLGTDDEILVSILGNRNRAQREALAAFYGQRYGHSLVSDIKGDTSFNYQKLLIGLVTPFPEYIAHLIHHAVDGLGTREWILIDVLGTTPKPLIDLAAGFYKLNYKADMREAVKSDTSGNFRKALLHLMDGSKDWFSPPDFATVEVDAHELYSKGEGRPGTNDHFFVHFFTSKSPAHIFEVDRAYTAKRGHGLVRAIKNETSGDYKNLLIALATPHAAYWAQRIHDAVAGLGTNDTLLQRAFILNDKDILQQIAQVYSALYGKSMAEHVKDDTSGWYGKLLQALMR
eukprot:TRINITY_DN2276_c0_g1_i1.p1 TRINITY_DN2276_c0_g1~~TRINITY_DN2276_c0_g1_i1.p1  ORF type:complete len:302 (-),score=64.28 TRINITY_DN2276_c0_g1_i1:103-1008(-)